MTTLGDVMHVVPGLITQHCRAASNSKAVVKRLSVVNKTMRKLALCHMRNCTLHIDGQSNEAPPLATLLSNSKLDKVKIVMKPGAKNGKLLNISWADCLMH